MHLQITVRVTQRAAACGLVHSWAHIVCTPRWLDVSSPDPNPNHNSPTVQDSIARAVHGRDLCGSCPSSLLLCIPRRARLGIRGVTQIWRGYCRSRMCKSFLLTTGYPSRLVSEVHCSSERGMADSRSTPITASHTASGGARHSSKPQEHRL